MRPEFRVRCAAILLACALTSAGGVAVPAAAPIPPVTQLLEIYSQGRFDEAVRAAASLAELEPFVERFVLEAPLWIRADPSAVGKRRSAAAAFVAELTHARLESDWKLLRELIEWSCTDLRAAGAPSSFERSWHLAVLALAGRARDRAWLLGTLATLPGERLRTQPSSYIGPLHMYHVGERFPDDTRLRLEWITAWTWGRDREPARSIDVRLPSLQFMSVTETRQLNGKYAIAAFCAPTDPRSADFVVRAAEQSGGGTHRSRFGDPAVRAFSRILADFRQSYVLRYSPTGVPPSGWHRIRVEVPARTGLTIKARSGYFGR